MNEVKPVVLKDAMDFLKAAVISRDGKPIDGNPSDGAYVVSMRKNMTFHGDREAVVGKLLPAAFPGCTFTWEE